MGFYFFEFVKKTRFEGRSSEQRVSPTFMKPKQFPGFPHISGKTKLKSKTHSTPRFVERVFLQTKPPVLRLVVCLWAVD